MARRDLRGARSLEVLVVDDEPDLADSAALLLSLLGHHVAVAYDGPSAVARAVSSTPDVVLLDVDMPGMDGYEVCRLMREGCCGRVPIVAVTSHHQERARLRALDAGFSALLMKPLELETLRMLFNAGLPP
jgi:CheY-like chemotaxis protein